jgi:hypothetical protein
MNDHNKKAKALFEKFRHGATGENCILAALEMKTHFYDCQGKDPKDEIGEEILKQFWPEIIEEEEEHTFLGKPVYDMTEGTPDTVEWILFLKIVDTDNPYYYEYDDALKNMHFSKSESEWSKKINKGPSPHKIKMVTAAALTIEEAAKSQNLKLSQKARILKRIETPSSLRVHQFEASNNRNASEKAEYEKKEDEVIKSISLKEKGKKGFIWIKGKPGVYEAQIMKKAQIFIFYTEAK